MRAVQVIGDADTVLALGLAGVPGTAVATAPEAHAAVDAVVEAVRADGGAVRHPSLLIVTEAAAEHLGARLERLMLDPAAPIVVEIPSLGSSRRESAAASFVDRLLGGPRR